MFWTKVRFNDRMPIKFDKHGQRKLPEIILKFESCPFDNVLDQDFSLSQYISNSSYVVIGVI